MAVSDVIRTLDPQAREEVVASFNANVKQSEDGCWEWLGTTTPDGYGHAHIAGVTVGAHRAAYELFVGEIPDDLHIDHTCLNRGCVNPAHLEPVTRSENTQRSYAAIANGYVPPPAPFDPNLSLKERRLNAGLSHEALAEAIGSVSAQALRKIEQRGHTPQPAKAKAIADYFGVTVTTLWPIEEKEAA